MCIYSSATCMHSLVRQIVISSAELNMNIDAADNQPVKPHFTNRHYSWRVNQVGFKSPGTKPPNLYLSHVALFNPRYLGTRKKKKRKCSCAIAWECRTHIPFKCCLQLQLLLRCLASPLALVALWQITGSHHPLPSCSQPPRYQQLLSRTWQLTLQHLSMSLGAALHFAHYRWPGGGGYSEATGDVQTLV